MNVTTDAIKTLREETSAGIMDCKKALVDAGGDINKAREALRQKGLTVAAKKAERETRQGLVEAYVHGGGRIGALVELNCETDFVARTDEFKALAHELVMQVAAMNPRYISREDIPPRDAEGVNPAEVCLLSQPFIRDSARTVQDVVTDVIAKVGENIRVRRFARYQLGD